MDRGCGLSLRGIPTQGNTPDRIWVRGIFEVPCTCFEYCAAEEQVHRSLILGRLAVLFIQEQRTQGIVLFMIR